MNPQYSQTSPSAIVSPQRGGAIIFQGGMLTQALVLTRSEVDRFLQTPAAVEPRVIPSFAAAGLATYTATGDVEYVSILRDPDNPEAFSLVIKLKRGDHIVYYSHPANAEGPAALAARGVTVVITPRVIATVHQDPRPSLSIVASLPQTQLPDLTAIYAVEIELLRDTLAEALQKSATNATVTADIWGLNESIRFPTGATGWESTQQIVPQTARPGAFQTILKARTPAENYALVEALMVKDPQAFETAVAAISPQGFRQLYHRGTYVIECLLALRFHADQALRLIVEQPDLFEDAPSEWLGTESDLRDVANETRDALRQIGVKSSCAVWAILSAAQSIPLSKAEVLHCRWWTTGWIKALSAHLRIK